MVELLKDICEAGNVTSDEELSLYDSLDDALILHVDCIQKNH